ncbi:MAG: hypothetical protein Q9225_007549 [Loekoesia sp. 1 TL-2023]
MLRPLGLFSDGIDPRMIDVFHFPAAHGRPCLSHGSHSLHRIYSKSICAPIFTFAFLPYAHGLSRQSPAPLRYPSMCFFKIDPEHAPIEPPGAAPTLVTLEEHYRAALAGEENGPKTALDGGNPASKSIAKSLDANDKLEPNRPVSNGSAMAAGKRKMSVPLGTKVTRSPR